MRKIDPPVPVVFAETLKVSRPTLESGPVKMFAFYTAVMKSPRIRAKLMAAGWGDKTQRTAAALLAPIDVAKDTPRVKGAPPEDATQKAIDRCEAFLDTSFVVARATLEMGYPEQAAFVCEGLVQTAEGAAALLTTSKFADRVTALESGPDRKSTRKADHAALEALDDAGVTMALVRGMQETAVKALDHVEKPVLDEVDPEKEAKRIENLYKIHAWMKGWSDIARAVITSRSDLIQLGIAKRRPKKAKAAPVPVPQPAESETRIRAA